MAVLLLLVAFGFACYAGWDVWSGWDAAVAAKSQWLLALKGLTLAGIPYVIARCFAELAGLRQRQLQLEMLGRLLAEQQMRASVPMPQAAARATQPAMPASGAAAPGAAPPGAG